MLRYNKIYEASIWQHMKNVPRKQMRQPFVSLWIGTNGMLQSEKDTNEKWREKRKRKKSYSIRIAEYPNTKHTHNTKRWLDVHEYSFAVASLLPLFKVRYISHLLLGTAHSIKSLYILFIYYVQKRTDIPLIYIHCE